MESLHVSTDTTGPENFDKRGGRSPLVMVIAVISALAVTGGLFAGYMFLKKRHADQVNAQQRQAQMASASKSAAPPVLQVFVDDAMLKGSQTIIGGTLLNISREEISDLSVELELRPRKGGNLETRAVSVEPQNLAPNQQGRYSLKLSTQDYSHARLLRIKSGSRTDEVAFKTVPGAQRPPEVIKPEVKTIIVKQPPKRGNGEEFINTPDTPAKIH
jgi:hypothetical protein